MQTLAHSADETSIAAAVKSQKRAAGVRRKIIESIGEDHLCSDDIADRIGEDDDIVNRRVVELREQGILQEYDQEGVTHRKMKAIRWYHEKDRRKQLEYSQAYIKRKLRAAYRRIDKLQAQIDELDGKLSRYSPEQDYLFRSHQLSS